MESDKHKELLANALTGNDGNKNNDAALGVTMTDPSAPKSIDHGAELATGTTLGRYRIKHRLGAGGMGVVYRANDPDLDRDVAVKVLHDGPEGSRPSELLQQRLMREAKSMARLSHPNLVTVYDVGSVNSHVFIAMELVEGKTLRTWMAQPEHSWRERVRVLIDAGTGLAAAHAAGVIHRDFKPDNVLIGDHVQVVDFGLARTAAEAHKPSAEKVARSQHTTNLTHTGALLGTPAYMSPEQHRGEVSDARSDQFSFAITAFHALCGYRPFRGDTVAEISAQVLDDQRRLPPQTVEFPAAVFTVIERALQTDPADRYPSMRALLADLERAAAPIQRRQRAWLFPAMVTAIAATIVAVVLLRKPAAPTPDNATTKIVTDPSPAPPRQLTFRGDVTQVDLSPNGRHLAYVTGDRLIVRHITTGNETTVHQAPNFMAVDWSEDSARLLYSMVSSARPMGTYIYSVTDKKQHRVTQSVGKMCFFSKNEVAVSWLTVKRIAIIDIDSQQRRWQPFDGDYVWLRAIDCAEKDQRFLIQTSSKSHDALWTMRFDGSQRELLLDEPNIEIARWAAAGDAVFYARRTTSGRQLMRLAIDKKTGRPIGKPKLMLAELDSTGLFSVALDGTLAYVRGRRSSNLWSVKRKADGTMAEPVRLTRGTATKLGATLSPDQTQIAYTTRGPNGVHVMVQPRAAKVDPRVVASIDTVTAGLAWSPDGKQLAVLPTDKTGAPELKLIDVSSGKMTKLGVPTPSHSAQLAWSQAGPLLYQLPGNRNYNLVDPVTSKVSKLIPKTVGWFFDPRFSPTGDKVAVFWNRSPRGAWWIDMKTRTATLAAKGEKLPVGWSKDGRWLYVRANNKHGPAPLERIRLSDGKLEPWLTLPKRFKRLLSAETINDGQQFLLNLGEGSSDVWIVKP